MLGSTKPGRGLGTGGQCLSHEKVLDFSKIQSPGHPLPGLRLCPSAPPTVVPWAALLLPHLSQPFLLPRPKAKCFIKQTQHLLWFCQGLRQACRNRQYLPSPSPSWAPIKVICAKTRRLRRAGEESKCPAGARTERPWTSHWPHLTLSCTGSHIVTDPPHPPHKEPCKVRIA